MGWEQRGNSSYYYRKEREGSRVKSVYVGRGEIAHMIGEVQSSSPLVEKLARTMKSRDTVEQEGVDASLDHLRFQVQTLTEGLLLLSGFHTHKRQWRKIRNG